MPFTTSALGTSLRLTNRYIPYDVIRLIFENMHSDAERRALALVSRACLECFTQYTPRDLSIYGRRNLNLLLELLRGSGSSEWMTERLAHIPTLRISPRKIKAPCFVDTVLVRLQPLMPAMENLVLHHCIHPPIIPFLFRSLRQLSRSNCIRSLEVSHFKIVNFSELRSMITACQQLEELVLCYGKIVRAGRPPQMLSAGTLQLAHGPKLTQVRLAHSEARLYVALVDLLVQGAYCKHIRDLAMIQAAPPYCDWSTAHLLSVIGSSLQHLSLVDRSPVAYASSKW